MTDNVLSMPTEIARSSPDMHERIQAAAPC